MKRLRSILDPGSLYRLSAVRYLVVLLRMHVLVKSRGLRRFEGHGSDAVTVSHNVRSLARFNPRNEKLLYACLHIEDIEAAKTLIVGCRNEEELFLFRGFGFRDVAALDLISYSPKVELGDMHDIDREDDSVDFLYCAYTIVYSKTPAAAAEEFLRVVRDGGIIAVSVEYTPWDQREEIENGLLGYDIIPDRKLETADDILALFGSAVGDVHVRYDAVQKRHHSPASMVPDPSPLIAVFSVDKSA